MSSGKFDGINNKGKTKLAIVWSGEPWLPPQTGMVQDDDEGSGDDDDDDPHKQLIWELLTLAYMLKTNIYAHNTLLFCGSNIDSTLWANRRIWWMYFFFCLAGRALCYICTNCVNN